MRTKFKAQPEFALQCQICQYLKIQYPKVLFQTDTIAAIKLTPQQQNRNKLVQKQDFHAPDLQIFAARGPYHGLFIELKAETPFKRDGTLKKDKHLEDQQRTLKELSKEKYLAMFAWDFNTIKDIIDDYLLFSKT